MPWLPGAGWRDPKKHLAPSDRRRELSVIAARGGAMAAAPDAPAAVDGGHDVSAQPGATAYRNRPPTENVMAVAPGRAAEVGHHAATLLADPGHDPTAPSHPDDQPVQPDPVGVERRAPAPRIRSSSIRLRPRCWRIAAQSARRGER
jgi:hypothetical protein